MDTSSSIPPTPLQRKLKALNYHTPSVTPIHDDSTQLKTLVVWLEDQKIRYYKIDEREPLRSESDSNNWLTIFKKYLSDIKCPHDVDNSLTSCLHWLIDEAVRCEYNDACKTHPNLGKGLKTIEEIKVDQAHQSALDVSSSDPIFEKGITALAKLLQITTHPDPTVLLAACRLVIEEKLSDASLTKAQEGSTKKPKNHDITPKQCGFNLGDPVLSEAAKVLRLLHIEELRELQTKVNELIVAVQSITANPKTDSTLGKVGK